MRANSFENCWRLSRALLPVRRLQSIVMYMIVAIPAVTLYCGGGSAQAATTNYWNGSAGGGNSNWSGANWTGSSEAINAFLVFNGNAVITNNNDNGGNNVFGIIFSNTAGAF